LQSRDGFLWMTTFDGLVRFDGFDFKVYNVSNTPGLLGNRLVAVMESRDGTLWVGAEDGRLYAFRDGKATAYRPESQASPLPIVGLTEAADGRILAIDWSGVYEAIPGEPELRTVVAFKSDQPEKRALWSAYFGWLSAEGLTSMAHGIERHYVLPPSLPPVTAFNKPYRALWQDERDRMWLVNTEDEVWRSEGDSFVRQPFRVAAKSEGNVAFMEDRRGALWVGGRGIGVQRIDPNGTVNAYGPNDGVDADFVVTGFLEDADGTIWVGTGTGLLRYRGELVGNAGPAGTPYVGNARSVIEDAAGRVWIAGPTLMVADGVHGEFKDAGFQWPSCLALGRGGLWIGGGLDTPVHRVVDDRIEPVAWAAAISTERVNAILEDATGALWVGTDNEGLYRHTPDGTVTRFDAANGLAADAVTCLFEDGDGSIWIGTVKGLSRYYNGQLQSWRAGENGIKGGPVRWISRDESGALLLGYYDRGIGYSNGAAFTTVSTEHGLPTNGAFGILGDGDGHLWVSSNIGIYRIDRQALIDVAEGRVSRLQAVLYGRDDGMVKSECNGGFQNAAVRTRGGELLFANQAGAVVIQPSAQRRAARSPEPRVEAAIIDGKLTDIAGGLRVEPGVTTFEILFTAPSFVKPEFTLFRYRLAGLSDWTDAGPRRSASLSYIPPGQYTFEVMAVNSDGVWSARPASIPVVVLAPWWRTTTALVLMLAGFSLLVILVVRLRFKALHRRSVDLEMTVAQRTQELTHKTDELSHAVERLQQSERVALAAKEEAIEASMAKSVFLANMSHELRTPLNAVLGFAQLMARDADRSEEDRECLQVIRRSGEHLLGLIDEVLSIAKIEAGKLTLTEAPFNFPERVHSVAEMIRVRAESKGIAFTLQVSPGLPRTVVGDEGKLGQVLINLLGNAVKFTDCGGVTLRATWCDGRAEFEVDDTGYGIEESELNMLFNPFEQTATGKQVREGTGLGLAITKELVHLMGGTIDVWSELGVGTVFRFDVRLPLASEVLAERGPRRVMGLAPGQRQFKVLIVDDVFENRRLMSRLLTGVGFDVREAADGQEAVEAWESWRPDFVWMDVRMPVVDGLEATRRIRSRERELGSESRCKIVALSASVLEQQRAAILDAGCDDFVGKPFVESAIFESMAALLGIEYLYEAEQPPTESAGQAIDPARLAAVDRATLLELSNILAQGDVRGCTGPLDRIAATDEELATWIRATLKRYAVDDVLEVVTAALAEQPTLD
jgi:signal transduction histidine kinase/CheY-like chemotaxis protein/ligand-binding sensor domain-containing protein